MLVSELLLHPSIDRHTCGLYVTILHVDSNAGGTIKTGSGDLPDQFGEFNLGLLAWILLRQIGFRFHEFESSSLSRPMH